jgi:hypothetical protein
MIRSELVFGAMAYVSNRFLLTNLTTKATRKLHKSNHRIEDTTNDILVRFSRANPIAGAPYAGNLQLFPCAAQGEIPSLGEDLKQSVA